jgi:hypothetical protein
VKARPVTWWPGRLPFTVRCRVIAVAAVGGVVPGSWLRAGLAAAVAVRAAAGLVVVCVCVRVLAECGRWCRLVCRAGGLARVWVCVRRPGGCPGAGVVLVSSGGGL